MLVVQRVLDGSSEVPVDLHPRLISADIAAARIASEATVWRQGLADDPNSMSSFNPDTAYDSYEQRCEGVERDFADVVDGAVWNRPQEVYEGIYDSPGVVPGGSLEHVAFLAGELKAAARCVLTVRAGLGG